MNTKLASLVLVGLFVSSFAFALTPGAQLLVHLETKANGVAIRSELPIMMPHFEIPVEFLEANYAERINSDYLKHLIFNKDGKNYLRWILNPEDTQWSKEVSNYFKTKGVVLEKKYYFTGYQTASRSYIVEDPDHEIQFSVKSSTNKTGGNWTSKKQPVGEAVDSRLNADWLADVQKKLAFKNIIIMDEPAIFAIQKIDQAVVIRDIGELNDPNSEMIYIPGFSVLHELTGIEIAKRNGSNDPKSFWRENYIKPVGRALGELAARTGMQFDSPHSQNFLVEMTKDYKPTGRIVLRDLADLYIYKDVAVAIHPDPEAYFKMFTQKENIINSIAAGFGPLHGNIFPNWLSFSRYESWMEDFFSEFEKIFEAESKIPIEKVKSQPGSMDGLYYGNIYSIPKNSDTKEYWDNMLQFQTPTGVFNCSYVFLID